MDYASSRVNRPQKVEEGHELRLVMNHEMMCCSISLHLSRLVDCVEGNVRCLTWSDETNPCLGILLSRSQCISFPLIHQTQTFIPGKMVKSLGNIPVGNFDDVSKQMSEIIGILPMWEIQFLISLNMCDWSGYKHTFYNGLQVMFGLENTSLSLLVSQCINIKLYIYYRTLPDVES
jgi:hypothetical protein